MKTIKITFGLGKHKVTHEIKHHDVYEAISELKAKGWVTSEITKVSIKN